MLHRPQRPTRLVEPGFKPSIGVSSALFSTASSRDLTYSLFAPLHYERGYKYPLIVWLHGCGADERQLLRIMPVVSVRNYVAVAPRGLLSDTESDCRTWDQTSDHIEFAEQRVFECIDIARQRYSVNAGRVFLAGFGCGGTMAFRLAMRYPLRFAGVASFCGSFPKTAAPFSHLVDARRVPIFVAAGRGSARYTEDLVCEDLRLLHSAGMLITLRQYPCGHELSPQMLTDMDKWIMEQITAPKDESFECDGNRTYLPD